VSSLTPYMPTAVQPVLPQSPAQEAFDPPGRTLVTIAIVSAVSLCALTVVAVLIAALLRPDNVTILTAIPAITGPIIASLISAALYAMYKSHNGKFSQLMKVTNEQSERVGRAKVIRQLYWQLQDYEPGSPEFIALSEQIQRESMLHFDAIDHRKGGGNGPASGVITTPPRPDGEERRKKKNGPASEPT
jgi:hypothetical protein